LFDRLLIFGEQPLEISVADEDWVGLSIGMLDLTVKTSPISSSY